MQMMQLIQTRFLPESLSNSTEENRGIPYPVYDEEAEVSPEGEVFVPSEEFFADEIDDDDRELMKDVLNVE